MERRLFLTRLPLFPAVVFNGIPLLASQAQQGRPIKLAGQVRYYEPGKRIGIDIQPQVEKIYDLTAKDCTYVVDPDVRVGSNVITEEKKEENGKKMVSIRVQR
ncbi:MAG: hypothetical protein JWO80_5830 [Bryobacterales bacterium]|nr:hypothetical protein [Bryobacterales bacterium]